MNLSLGTDGGFGPWDLANERVVPGGVGYKDGGEAAALEPPSCLAAGHHHPFGCFVQLVSLLTFCFCLLPLKL